MPATSDKQKRFMDAAAHNPAFAKKAGVPVSVAEDFSKASKGIKFGGNKSRPDLQKVNEPQTRQGKTELFNKGGNTMASKMNPGFMAMMAKKKGAQEGSKADMASDKKQMMAMKKGGAAKKMAIGGGIETKGKTKGTMIKMKNGGKAC